MNHVCKPSKILLAIVLFAGGFTIIGWQKAGNPIPKSSNFHQPGRDTSHPGKPAAPEYRIEELDKAKKQLDIELKQMDEQMKKMDFSKIQKEVSEALAKIDFEKIKLETEKALKNIDWNNIKLEVEKAMKEAKENLEKIDSEKFRAEMHSLQEQLNNDHLKVKIDAEKIQKEVDHSLKKAKEGIEKTKLELKNLNAFTDALDRDKLIDKKKDYTIKVADGSLYINGVEQSNETYEKYREFYKKGNFTIKGNDVTTSVK